jgi:acetyl esterase
MPLSFKTKLLLFLDRLDGINIAMSSPEQSRARMKKGFTRAIPIIHYPAEKLFLVKDEWIPVANDGQIKLRIYKPSDSSNLPLLMFFHGGGFVQGDIDIADLNCRRLSKHNNCIVVSVDYRLAPEFPFPTPGEDCYAAVLWANEHANSLGADGKRVIVMGDSAGGNLAAVVAMMARDKGGPAISGQVLIYPAVDATLSMNTVNEFGKGYFLTKEMMEWFTKHYCGNENDLKQPYLSPLFASNLTNLPPALIITGEYDPLKGEGELYAERLKAAGNLVIFKEYEGMIHGFFYMPRYFKSARYLEVQIKESIQQFIGIDA